MTEIKKKEIIDWKYTLLNIEVGKPFELGSKYFRHLASIRVIASDLKTDGLGVWKINLNPENLHITITRIV